MSIQFLGMIGHRLSSETIAPVGPIFDRDYIVRFAQTHEAAGFDRLLVGHWSDQPDGFLVTALAGLSTQKIQYLLAHRPGFVSPTLAARKFATLEHLLGGRLAVHIISGGNDAWHAPLRQQVFHDAVEHGGLINSLRVEPELGSPARGGLPDTVATRRAEGWDISGHKIYTTGIEGLRWLAVWARSDDNPPLVGTWLVPGDSPGITVVKSWDHAGMRATGSHEVIFNHVRVAAEHAVDVWPADAPPAAEAEPFRLFANRQTALLAAIYDSIAHAAHDWLVRWLAGRVPAGLGHPLSRLPRVQEKVGQIAGLLLVNRSLLEQAAALRFSAIEANLAKVTITDNAIQAVNIALELTGNHGLSRQNPLERHYRNVLCGRVHTPQSDSAWLAAGNFVFQSQG
ncbi:butyryl-CoA dehydrogenase [Klebsiella pneumoniae]|nr:LLM class flavin-dependent oxidoreductase [Klebsiella pneumoniae]SSF10029.1 butyryl-CoA dehydrogenase [Klebsiella pneumoniae]